MQVDLGVGDDIIGAAVADDQQQHVRVGAVDEAVRIPGPGREAGAALRTCEPASVSNTTSPPSTQMNSSCVLWAWR